MLESSKLPLPKWFLAMHLMMQAKNGVSALELMRHLGVSYPTAWLLKHKLMEVMHLREQGRQLTGRAEIDDAYLGGEVQGGKAGLDLAEQGRVRRCRADHRIRRARPHVPVQATLRSILVRLARAACQTRPCPLSAIRPG